ncbi:MAG: DNA-directed RNA polymerase subunit beta [Coriobacteriales bacterium]|nr:DNA-directed RNA polymerase subunit beta [Coriobacteriales bacterium]
MTSKKDSNKSSKSPAKVASSSSKIKTNTYRQRLSFGKRSEVYDIPNLIAVQKDSYRDFLTNGIAETLQDMTPIENTSKTLSLEIYDHEFGAPKCSEEECKIQNISYVASLTVSTRLINKETGEVSEPSLKFLGDFPLMTNRGTFIINGTERVVVSQLVRSPGVYFSSEVEKITNKTLYACKLIPMRGAWVEFELDRRDAMYLRIDRKRKMPATLLLRALGIAQTNDEILKLFANHEVIKNSIEKDSTCSREEAVTEIFKKLRPGEVANIETAKTYVENMFYNHTRYDLGDVGRYKVNKKLGIKEPIENHVLMEEDIVKTIKYLLGIFDENPEYSIDDIDHFGNRRIRCVGELVKHQFRVGMGKVISTAKERMTNQAASELTADSIIYAHPIEQALNEFFGSSQLSQFMDQTNPASGITHKRRLSALGPGGLSRERAGMDVRDVHTSHYGRMCPIETPEGANIGLIGSLATYAKINRFGFVETPYRRVENGKVTDIVDYLPADEEENFVIAQANEQIDEKTGAFVNETVLCRKKNSDGVFGDPAEVEPKDVDYMDVSPRQMTSVATALIPFLEHDDANRALMGSNMQRQAVPLLRANAPFVGTGIEHRIAVDSGELPLAEHDGKVLYVDSQLIKVQRKDGTIDDYVMQKFQRSNQGGCVNNRPLVKPGDSIKAGDALADGPSTDHAELALGQNLLIAYMPWEGFNYEDAIIVSERVVSEDLLSSIHIDEFEVEARDTKLGAEEITREVPNLSQDYLADLDADGIIRIGAEVAPGDILVGKVSPKGEADLTAEERLLRAIFGEKARDVKDTSLKVPHGKGGRVINIVSLSKEKGDTLKAGVNELIRVYVAQKRKIQAGDKLSGRHGNKGVISRILPVEDMPYMSDGTPIDVILNPLGVPSRMNVGQLLENHLGWAAKNGWDDEDKLVDGPFFVSTPVFDGAREDEISECILKANDNCMRKAQQKYGDMLYEPFVPQLLATGKTTLRDGRTGEVFREPITVGYTYILKLAHMVDDKIHARSTGPYSLITQQPLGGKAQFGGQRFGEMEVWALYSYGASNVLQEILTVKSDDTSGRQKTYEAIVKGENIPAPEVPESFKVLLKEMKSLCLDVELIGSDNEIKDEDSLDGIKDGLEIPEEIPEEKDDENILIDQLNESITQIFNDVEDSETNKDVDDVDVFDLLHPDESSDDDEQEDTDSLIDIDVDDLSDDVAGGSAGADAVLDDLLGSNEGADNENPTDEKGEED